MFSQCEDRRKALEDMAQYREGESEAVTRAKTKWPDLKPEAVVALQKMPSEHAEDVVDIAMAYAQRSPLRDPTLFVKHLVEARMHALAVRPAQPKGFLIEL